MPEHKALVKQCSTQHRQTKRSNNQRQCGLHLTMHRAGRSITPLFSQKIPLSLGMNSHVWVCRISPPPITPKTYSFCLSYTGQDDVAFATLCAGVPALLRHLRPDNLPAFAELFTAAVLQAAATGEPLLDDSLSSLASRNMARFHQLNQRLQVTLPPVLCSMSTSMWNTMFVYESVRELACERGLFGALRVSQHQNDSKTATMKCTKTSHPCTMYSRTCHQRVWYLELLVCIHDFC